MKTEEDEYTPCEVCNDRASFGAWDIPEYSIAHFCEGCGGLLGVDYGD